MTSLKLYTQFPEHFFTLVYVTSEILFQVSFDLTKAGGILHFLRILAQG